jgi:hypothetical protein
MRATASILPAQEENAMPFVPRPEAAKSGALQKRRALRMLDSAAGPALDNAISAGLAGYERVPALSRLHRLSAEAINGETAECARVVLREIERALRAERARRGHWSYDLNKHIALHIAHRAESARLARLDGGVR